MQKTVSQGSYKSIWANSGETTGVMLLFDISYFIRLYFISYNTVTEYRLIIQVQLPTDPKQMFLFKYPRNMFKSKVCKWTLVQTPHTWRRHLTLSFFMKINKTGNVRTIQPLLLYKSSKYSKASLIRTLLNQTSLFWTGFLKKEIRINPPDPVGCLDSANATM
jgi:hypothetical protein